jgi:hypothetical protein
MKIAAFHLYRHRTMVKSLKKSDENKNPYLYGGIVYFFQQYRVPQGFGLRLETTKGGN